MKKHTIYSQLTFYLLLFILSSSSIIHAQQLVRGTILDATSQEPLFAVNIYSPNTKEGTVSQIDGTFEFTSRDSIFQVSYIGYNEQIFPVSDQTFRILLQPDTAGLIICYVYDSPLIENYPSTTRLDKRSIQLNNETSIAPTLNLTPGVLMHSGAYNTNRITIRGIGNRNLFGTAKIRAFLDDISLTDGSGETTLEDIDLDIIEKVTVHKGPAGSLYGAGLGGMIRLQTTEDFQKPTGTGLTFSSTAGSYGLNRYNFQLRRHTFDKNFLHVNFTNTNSDGYRDNNIYDRTNLSAYSKVKLNDTDEVSMLINYVRLFSEIPSSLDSTDFADDPSKAAFIWDQAEGNELNTKTIIGASYKSRLGLGIYQSTSISVIVRESDEVRPFDILRENVITKALRTEWNYTPLSLPEWVSTFKLTAGAEIFHENNNYQMYETDGRGAQQDIFSDNLEERHFTNFFSQLRLAIRDKLNFTLGLNRNYLYYKYNDYFLSDGNDSSNRIFPTTWSPFLNLTLPLEKWLTLSQPLILSATISHGFSPPTSSEARLPGGQLNPDIRSEKGWNYELGLQGTFKNDLSYKLSLYSMRINDLVVAQRDDFDRFIGTNAGSTIHNGLELSLRYTKYWKDYAIEPFINYTYADYTFEKFIEEDINYSGNELTGTSPHLLNAGVFWSNSKFFGNVVYRFVDAMPLRDDNSIYSDAYQLLDLKLGYKYSFAGRWALEAFAGINNIFDKKYASMFLINAGSFGGNAPRYYYPGLPRNFYAGLKINLN
jgi:iron complex outermembrane receptor protein